MENILIQARGVKPYIEGNESFPSINLNILPSTIISIIGPVSGGKNIWLKTLSGMLELETGELILLGHNMSDMQRDDWLSLRKDIAYVGQDTSLLSVLSVMENVLLPASYHKLAGRNELIKQARSMLFEIGFNDEQAFNQLPAYVNLTQRYYAMLVRAFMLNPKVVFIDDMFSQLGATASGNINKFLQKRKKYKKCCQNITKSSNFFCFKKSNIYKYFEIFAKCYLDNKQVKSFNYNQQNKVLSKSFDYNQSFPYFRESFSLNQN